MNLELRELREFGDLEKLAPEWGDLWRRIPNAHPFQSPPWLLAWWRAFAPGDIRSVAVYGADRLVGLAPFYLESGPFGRRVLPIGISVSDYHDVLMDPAAAPAVARRLAGHFAQMDCDGWELPELAPDADALRMTGFGGGAIRSEAQDAVPVLELNGTELASAVPPRQMRKLRMARHRAGRRGAHMIRQAGPDAARDAFEALARLHRARWQGRGESGVLADDRVLRFHRDALPGLFALAIARLYMLTFGDDAAGVYYGFVHRTRAYAYLGGFDPAYAFESPGALLIAHAIECAIGEGAREFHFLRGREPYKYAWGAVDRWSRRCVGAGGERHAKAG